MQNILIKLQLEEPTSDLQSIKKADITNEIIIENFLNDTGTVHKELFEDYLITFIKYILLPKYVIVLAEEL